MTPLKPEDYDHRHDQRYERARVALDGCFFTRCHFEDCVLVFAGRAGFFFEKCSFGPCTVALEDDAKRIFGFVALRFGDDVARQILTDIRLEGFGLDV